MRRFVRDVHGRFTEVRSEVPDLPVRSSRRISLNELFNHEEARIANHFILTGEMPTRTPAKAEAPGLVRSMQAAGELPRTSLEPPAEPDRILTEDECRQRIERMKREGRLPSFERAHAALEDALDAVNERMGNEPRERIFPRRVKRVQ